MDGWFEKFLRFLGGFWNDLSYATASGTVQAVRYQPRRLRLTGGPLFETAPAGSGALVVTPPSNPADSWLDRLAVEAGHRFGASAEAWVRWLTGAAGGVIDQVGASAIDDLSFRRGLSPRMLRPHSHTVAILFLDMRGFSTLTVALDDTQHLTDRIGEYLSLMTLVVEQHRGIVLQYMGDGLLALFLPELSGRSGQELVEYLAGPVSRELHAAFHGLHTRWREEWDESGRTAPRIGLAVGVVYGSATIGLIGPPGKKYFGVIGAPVNLAAYLCSKAEAGTTLIDEESFRQTGAVPPGDSKRIRLRSEKLHQRIATIRIRPRLAFDA